MEMFPFSKKILCPACGFVYKHTPSCLVGSGDVTPYRCDGCYGFGFIDPSFVADTFYADTFDRVDRQMCLMCEGTGWMYETKHGARNITISWGRAVEKIRPSCLNNI
jgi:rubredoxin